MRQVSATEAKQSFGAIIDAAQREPVVIRRQKRDVAVVLSIEEYNRLRSINIKDFQDFCDRVGSEAEAKGLTEEGLQQLLDDAS